MGTASENGSARIIEVRNECILLRCSEVKKSLTAALRRMQRMASEFGASAALHTIQVVLSDPAQTLWVVLTSLERSLLRMIAANSVWPSACLAGLLLLSGCAAEVVSEAAPGYAGELHTINIVTKLTFRAGDQAAPLRSGIITALASCGVTGQPVFDTLAGDRVKTAPMPADATLTVYPIQWTVNRYGLAMGGKFEATLHDAATNHDVWHGRFEMAGGHLTVSASPTDNGQALVAQMAHDGVLRTCPPSKA